MHPSSTQKLAGGYLKMSGASAFDPDCRFCRIAKDDPNNQVKWRSKKERSSVFMPLGPVGDHRLIIPHRHFTTAIEDPTTLSQTLADVVEYAYDHQLKRYILVFNVGAAATQTVFHTHGHIMPRGILEPIDLPWRRSLWTELLYLTGLKVCTLCKLAAAAPRDKTGEVELSIKKRKQKVWLGGSSMGIRPKGAISDSHWILALRGSHPVGEVALQAMLYMMAQDLVAFAHEKGMEALNIIYIHRWSLASGVQHPIIHVIGRKKGDEIRLPWTEQHRRAMQTAQ